jgi:pimeloyl-ACP methyl ester carboxylesterase
VASAAPELAESELTRALARGENLLIPGADDGDRFMRMVVEKPPKVPRAVQRYVAARRAAARHTLEEMFRGWVEAAPADALPRDLDAIDHPTLIIHGRCDRIIAVDTARKVAARCRAQHAAGARRHRPRAAARGAAPGGAAVSITWPA